MKSGKYRRGVFIVAYSFEKEKPIYLILKRKLHWKGWEFPKGGKKDSESYEKSAKREIFEETGQRPSRIIKLNVNGKYKYPKKLEDRPGVVGQTYKLYAVKIKKSGIKIDKIEHANYKWVSFENAMKKLTWKNQKKCLKVVDDWLKRK